MNLLPNFASRGELAPLLNKIHHCDALELLRRLPDASVSMILTDPPYNVTQAHYEKELDLAAYGREFFRVIKPNGAVISTAAQPFTSKLVMAWEKYFCYEWIWRKTRKTNFLNAKKMPLAAHESILVFGHKLPDYYPQMIVGEKHDKGLSGALTVLYGEFHDSSFVGNSYYPDTVLEYPHDPNLSRTKAHGREWSHPNSKPLALWQYLINTYTLQGDIVLDVFSGGAVTAIACTNLDRRFICGDNHEPYVFESRNRLQRHDPMISTELKTGEKQLSLFSA